ncbi:MAG TPA: dihydropteroate synthase [Candidatus Cloacimonetes bacterium]|nr:dihydropteroate synthase [Candidatus Cloacimonadota bacterium]HEX37538.1 dihydropteroate synthase [Candidatus Cloacimonadota bacterium]
MDRILTIRKADDCIAELKRIGVTSRGIESMYMKSHCVALKLKNIKLGAANIIKQDMLSLGGDAAVCRGVVNGTVERTDVIVMGNLKQINSLLQKLSFQDIFEIPEIRKRIEKLLEIHTKKIPYSLQAGEYTLKFDRTHIMGILNATPDSFYDGGRYNSIDTALLRIERMVNEGADIIDIGGESTRPFAEKINVEQEIDRVIPIIKKARQRFDIPLSIDTSKADVARAALDEGAHIVNDISGLHFDPNMAKTIAEYNDVGIVVMHIKGTPQDMQVDPTYDDVVEEILTYLGDSISIAKKSGISQNQIIVDPGIGFGKRVEDNVAILHKLAEFKCLDAPVLVGCSNKSFIGWLLKSEKDDRLEGTLGAHAYAITQGANILRVHEVAEHKKLAQIIDVIKVIH